jgi:hypothetical protein
MLYGEYVTGEVFETVLGLTRLSASRRPSTHQMVADRSGMLNGLGRRWTAAA